MPVESTADRAAFFNADEFAEAGLYAAPGGGASVPCTVIVDRGQGRKAMELAGGRAAGVDRLIQVLAEGAAEGGLTPARGGRFTLLDAETGAAVETVEVRGEPALDETGAWWTAEVLQVAG